MMNCCGRINNVSMKHTALYDSIYWQKVRKFNPFTASVLIIFAIQSINWFLHDRGTNR